MSPSRRKSTTKERDADPYISLSKAFFVGNGEEELFDVEKEEKEISRLTKLIEPDYLGQPADSHITEAHLKSAISESAQDIRNLKKPLEFLENVAADLVEFTNPSHDNQKNKESTILDEIDQHARDLIEDIRLSEFRKDQLEELRETVHASNNRTGRKRTNPSDNGFIEVHSLLCKKLSSQLSSWNSQTTRQKFAQDKSYKAFRQRIFEATGAQGIMPPVKTYLPAEEGDVEDSDESSGEELEVAGGAQNYKCPLCIGYLNEPVRSTVCNHTFCKGCFEGYLEQNRSDDAPCPTAGCSKLLSLSLVLPDESLAVKIRQLKRRQQLQEDTQDFDDEHPSQDPLHHGSDSDSKPKNLPKASSTQRKRRVIVED